MKLKLKEQEEYKWREEKKNLEREVKTLYKRLDELELMVHQFSRGKDFDPKEFKKDSEYYLTTYPAFRPPLKGERRLLTGEAMKMKGDLPGCSSGKSTGRRDDPKDPGRRDPYPGESSGLDSGPGPGPGSGSMAASEKEKKSKLTQGNEEELKDIKQQIKKVTLRKKELYKEAKEEKDGKGNSPKIKVISNIQLVPPRSADSARPVNIKER